jgi:hypothetical protein
MIEQWPVKPPGLSEQKWVRNGKDSAKAARMRAALAERRSRAPDGGRVAFGAEDDR